MPRQESKRERGKSLFPAQIFRILDFGFKAKLKMNANENQI